MKIKIVFHIVGILIIVCLFALVSIASEGHMHDAGKKQAAEEGGTVSVTVILTKGKLEQNSIVYLEGIAGEYSAPNEKAVLDQKVDAFVPHVLPVQLGQTVAIMNSDPHMHNVHPYLNGKTIFNVAQMAGNTRDWEPDQVGKHLILCDIHNEMSAFVVVFDHPFFTSMHHDPAGKEPCNFTFRNVPEGTYNVVLMRDIKGKLRTKKKEIVVKLAEITHVEF